MTTKFLGNCSHLIDFDKLVESLKNKEPDRISPTSTESLKPNMKKLSSIGFKSYEDNGLVKCNFYFEDADRNHCGTPIVDAIVKFTGVGHYTNSWISRVDPGFIVPPHTDELVSTKRLNRMHVFLQDSIVGHVMYIEDKYFNSYKKGDIFLWDDPYSLHASCNISFVPKFLLNIY
jgi:hypothetical protein